MGMLLLLGYRLKIDERAKRAGTLRGMRGRVNVGGKFPGAVQGERRLALRKEQEEVEVDSIKVAVAAEAVKMSGVDIEVDVDHQRCLVANIRNDGTEAVGAARSHDLNVVHLQKDQEKLTRNKRLPTFLKSAILSSGLNGHNKSKYKADSKNPAQRARAKRGIQSRHRWAEENSGNGYGTGDRAWLPSDIDSQACRSEMGTIHTAISQISGQRRFVPEL
ncbi:hypothetical protein K438DRAFT_1778185 [Mycena galopus ATCC 62051]|nr:hypothetical protein K438DRAFT_1778185 [Mycena galopus ATCC 62051]